MEQPSSSHPHSHGTTAPQPGCWSPGLRPLWHCSHPAMGAAVRHSMANAHVSNSVIRRPCLPCGRWDSTIIQLVCPLCYQFQLFLPAGFRFQLFQQSLVNTSECQIKETTCGNQNIPNCPKVCTSRLLRNLLPLGALASGHCSLGQEESLDEGLATHSSILSRRIPWTEEPGGLPSIESYTTEAT